MPSQIESKVRERLASNGRNPANNNAGIRTGSDLHYCEMLLAELTILRNALEPFSNIGLAQDGDKRAVDMIEGPDLAITPAQVRAARRALGHNI